MSWGLLGTEVDKRKFKRFAELDDVLIKDNRQALDTTADGAISAYTHNISISGARISCKEDFPVGTIIGITIDLKKANKSVRVDGKVIWSSMNRSGTHFHIGVEFLHKFPDTVLSLIKHLYGRKEGIPSSVH